MRGQDKSGWNFLKTAAEMNKTLALPDTPENRRISASVTHLVVFVSWYVPNYYSTECEAHSRPARTHIQHYVLSTCVLLAPTRDCQNLTRYSRIPRCTGMGTLLIASPCHFDRIA